MDFGISAKSFKFQIKKEVKIRGVKGLVIVVDSMVCRSWWS